MVILANAEALSIKVSALRDLLLGRLYKNDLENGVLKLVADLKNADAPVRKDAIIALGPSGSDAADGFRQKDGATTR